MITEIRVPTLGVNEDRVDLVARLVEDGDHVDAGAMIASLESTKTTFDLDSERGGIIAWLAEEGQAIAVQELIAVVGDAPHEIEAYRREREQADEGVPTATRKARRLAEEHGVAVESVVAAVGRTVRTQDVIRYLADRTGLAPDAGAEVAGVRAVQLGRIAILNGSGGGLAVLEVARSAAIEVSCLIDDNIATTRDRIAGIPVVNLHEFRRSFRTKVEGVFVHLQKDRKQRVVGEIGMPSPTLVHAGALVSEDVAVGEGVLIKAGAVVDFGSILNDHAIIDNGVIVPHDCRIGAYAHLAPGCRLGGDVRVGRGAVVGVGATIAPEISIGDESIILPGAAVREDVAAGMIVDGFDRIVGRSKRVLPTADQERLSPLRSPASTAPAPRCTP
jgi:UDP-perosamine 4-acetyltransferase